MPERQTDHDLLLELRGDVKALRDEVKNINDNIKLTIADHESRIRFLERYAWLAIGALAIIEIFIGIYFSQH